MDWLSEIEEDPWSTRKMLRMARVLREMAGYIQYIEDLLNWGKSPYTETIRSDYMSDDAKELCVAARESSREE